MALRKRIGGWQRGTPNRVTRAIREADECKQRRREIIQCCWSGDAPEVHKSNNGKAFELLQEDKTVNLVSWAISKPTEFYKMAANLIPKKLYTESEKP